MRCHSRVGSRRSPVAHRAEVADRRKATRFQLPRGHGAPCAARAVDDDGLVPAAELAHPRAQLIDRSLCDARNDIAHGKAFFPARDDYLTLHAEVLAMMEGIRDAILAAVATKAYRAPTG